MISFLTCYCIDLDKLTTRLGGHPQEELGTGGGRTQLYNGKTKVEERSSKVEQRSSKVEQSKHYCVFMWTAARIGCRKIVGSSDLGGPPHDLADPFKFVRCGAKRMERSSLRLGFLLRQGLHFKITPLSYINIKICFFCMRTLSETTQRVKFGRFDCNRQCAQDEAVKPGFLRG